MPPDSDLLNILKTAHPFRSLKDEALNLLAEELEVVLCKEGDPIYQYGEDARHFYLVVDGKVRLNRYFQEEAHQFGMYERGDMFGFEALVESNRYAMDAIAASEEVILLSFDENLLEALFNDEPQLAESMQRLYDSYIFSQKIPLDWLDVDEGVYYATLHHRLFILLRVVPPALLGLVVTTILLLFTLAQPSNLLWGLTIGSLVLFGLVFLWFLVDETNDYSIITNKRVVTTQKVLLLYESRQEIPLSAILSNSKSTSYWGRILGYGDIRIRTYTGSLLFRRLSAVQDVLSMLDEHRLRASVQQTRQQRHEMMRFLQRKLGMLPPEQAAAQAEGLQVEVRQGALSALLNRLFRLRIVQEDAIIYRTHWFVLLKRTFIPGFFGTLSFIGLIFSLAGWLPLLGGPITIFTFLVLWLGFSGWWLYKYIDWLNDRYIITKTQIMDVNKKPLGHEEKRTAALENILEIEYKRLGILGLLLNYGTVYILVGTEKFTFDEVYNPSEVQYELFGRMNAKKQKDKLEKDFQEREQIAEMLEVYHTITEAQRKRPL